VREEHRIVRCPGRDSRGNVLLIVARARLGNLCRIVCTTPFIPLPSPTSFSSPPGEIERRCISPAQSRPRRQVREVVNATNETCDGAFRCTTLIWKVPSFKNSCYPRSHPRAGDYPTRIHPFLAGPSRIELLD